MFGRVVLGALVTLILLSLAHPTTRRIWAFHLYAAKGALRWLAGAVGLGRRRSAPELLRGMAEDLGPTFIKLGQIVASSAGMFPQAYVDEFQKCLDRVRPFPFEEVQAILKAELGPRAARLTKIDPVPLASASIAQVHTAELDDGTRVVVKVQRPHLDGRVRADMRILRLVAGLAAKTVKDADLANPVAILDDFAATLAEELDFQCEAKNLHAFRRIMGELGHHPAVRAPIPVDELTTRRVLVMERFFGTRVDAVEKIRTLDVDAEAKLVHGLKAWFQSVLFYGFFHGDVHAGNLMILDDLTIGFLDFGIVGRFDERQRAMVTDYIIAFVTSDFRTLSRVIADMGGVAPGTDLEPMAKDLQEAYGPILKLSFGQINYADVLPMLHRVSAKHRIHMPKEFVLITKQMLYFDRYAKLLAPSLNIFTDPRLIASLMPDIARARAMNDEAKAKAAATAKATATATATA